MDIGATFESLEYLYFKLITIESADIIGHNIGMFGDIKDPGICETTGIIESIIIRDICAIIILAVADSTIRHNCGYLRYS